MRLFLPLLLAGSISGCIIYDEQLIPGPGGETGAPTDTDDPDPPGDPNPPADPTDPPAPQFQVTPGTATQGETLMVFVRSSGGALAGIAEVEIFGPSDLSVLASSQNGRNEYILTLRVARSSEAGTNDLLLIRDDGSAIFLNDVFTVVGDPLPPGTGGTECD